MNPATSNPTEIQNPTFPLARIDAQEESFIIPIREYLESNGCRVLSGASTETFETYHIVAGDPDFVKQIFSFPQGATAKTLVLIIGGSLSDAKMLLANNRKLVVVDPVMLRRQDVVEIFSFFFAGAGFVFDKRRNRHVPKEEIIKSEKIETSKTEKRNIEEETVQDETRIDDIITDVFGDDEKEKQYGKRMTHRKQKKQWKRFGIKVLFAILILCIPVVWYVASLVATGASFMQAAKQLETGNTTGAKQWERMGSYWLQQGRFMFSVFRVPMQLAGRPDSARGQERLLSFLSDTQTAFEQTHEVIDTGNDVAKIVLGNGTRNAGIAPAATLEQLKLATASLNSSLGLAQAQLATLLSDRTFPFLLDPLGRRGQDAAASLTGIRRMLSYGESLLAIYLRLAGFDEPKTYLILMQNSAELRPTGGFIGSIGKLTFDEGVMREFAVQDVYAVDGQLKGHVDPPLPIRELMSQEHWYLRDSNWDPDFRTSGARAAWFYEKETGESVDGVIGISLPLIVDILGVTGPVMLSDYNEQITADNFFGKSIFYTKNNFFPGSTAKADFLGSLSRALLLRITTDTRINPAQIFAAMELSISRRDVQFLFTDSELQQLVEHFGWAGRLFTGNGCQGVAKTACVFDPLAINEANLSVSKVNAFIKHNTHREIVIASDGTVTETLTMTITNTANDNEPGLGGPYRTYIRFYFPTDGVIDDVTLDGVPVGERGSSTAAGALPYTELVEAPEKTRALAAALEVAPGTDRRLRISYRRGIKMPLPDRDSSVLDVLQQKQAGLSDVAQTLTIHYPVFWKAKSESEVVPQVAKDGELEYNTILSRDLVVRVVFGT